MQISLIQNEISINGDIFDEHEFKSKVDFHLKQTKIEKLMVKVFSSIQNKGGLIFKILIDLLSNYPNIISLEFIIYENQDNILNLVKSLNQTYLKELIIKNTKVCVENVHYDKIRHFQLTPLNNESLVNLLTYNQECVLSLTLVFNPKINLENIKTKRLRIKTTLKHDVLLFFIDQFTNLELLEINREAYSWL